MSLIGPRPSPFRENQICVSWRRARLSVLPGISGLWQICRTQREGGDFHQWIYYDLLYVRNWSLWLDIKVLVATVITLGGRWSVPVERLMPAEHVHGYRDDAYAYDWSGESGDATWHEHSAA
jgi:lipopolysaccharide/colanic/teichoic acid biosynthesis glycosyltransferase